MCVYIYIYIYIYLDRLCWWRTSCPSGRCTYCVCVCFVFVVLMFGVKATDRTRVTTIRWTYCLYSLFVGLCVSYVFNMTYSLYCFVIMFVSVADEPIVCMVCVLRYVFVLCMLVDAMFMLFRWQINLKCCYCYLVLSVVLLSLLLFTLLFVLLCASVLSPSGQTQ